MAVHHYGLYPWTWDAGQWCHRPPDGARAVLDFRNDEQQATVGQSGGYGFFDWMDDIERPADAISLGDGDCREILPSTAVRDELRIKLGLSSSPSGNTLVDCISSVLGDLSDPTGVSGPRPIMPTSEGNLEMWLSGHSRVWNIAYDPASVLHPSPGGRGNKQREIWRDIISKAVDIGEEHASLVLGWVLKIHGYSDAEIAVGAPSKANEWKRLIRKEDFDRTGGRIKPKTPKTSFSDSFDRANSSTLGSSWSTYLSSAQYAISSNKALGGKASTWGSNAMESARFNSDVSSSDHWSECTISNYASVWSSDTWCGSSARFSASAHTCYYYAHLTRPSTGNNRLDKIVSGTMTALGGVSVANADGDVVRCNCSGSSISGKKNGVTQVTVTDTSITGNTRGGLIYRSANYAVQPTYDNFSVDDGLSAGAAKPVLFHAYYMSQGMRP